MLLVVALVTRLAWMIARYVSEGSIGDGALWSMEIAVWLATTAVAAIAMADLASRLRGRRKLGALIAGCAYAIYFANFVAMSMAVHAGWNDWREIMSSYGWRALDVVAIVGVTVAAGHRATWIAAPAIAVALIGHPSFAVTHGALLWTTAVSAMHVALVLIILQEAERFAAHDANDRRLARGFRVLEVGCWMCVGCAAAEAIPAVSVPANPTIALVSNLCLFAARLTLASGAFSVVRSRMAGVPRWLFAIAMTGILWSAMRTARSWTLTLSTKWNRYETVHLTHVSKWITVPSSIAWVCLATALVVIAKRIERPSRRAQIALALIVAGVIATPVPLPNLLAVALGIGGGAAIALAMRTVRRDVQLVHERAMHAHTFA